MFDSSQNVLIHDSNVQHTTYNQLGVTRGFDILAKSVAPNAFHHSDDRPDPPKCHENTRVAVINKIIDWVMGKIDTDTFFLWLYGPAGCGKTAIARTVAERCEELNLLLASFFFFRTDPRRNNLTSFVASIAYCIAVIVPASKPIVESVLETNPLILQCSLDTQLTKLVCEPLQTLLEQDHFRTTPCPPLIIIDGLDECLDEDSQAKLISALACAMRRHHLPLRILIASRPEQHIKYAFSTLKPHLTVSHLQLTNEYIPSEDIRQFLVDKFDAIKRNHPFASRISMLTWPSEEQVESLVRKSSGQFIFASVAARFVDSPHHLPSRRLDIVLNLRHVDRDLPFAELDKLYGCILFRASQLPLVLKILGIYIALQKDYLFDHRLCAVENILALEDGEAGVALSDVQALLECRIDGGYIDFHHSSFVDFLLNQQRSKKNHVDISSSHGMIAQWVLRRFRQDTLDHQLVNTSTLKFIEHPRLFDIPKELFYIDLACHLKRSIKMLDLQDDLENFALDVYLRVRRHRNTSWFIMPAVKTLIDLLKQNNSQDLQYRYCQLLEQFVTYELENCPSPGKFQLISTLYFVLAPNYLASTTGRLQDSILSAGSEFQFSWKDLWKDLCVEVFGLDSTDSTWDWATYKVLDFHPEGFEHANTVLDLKISEDGREYGTSAGIEPVDVHYGRVEATSKHVPQDVLSHRLLRVAIAFYQYLRDFGSTLKNPAKPEGLHVFARKSVLIPWLSRRRTGRGFDRRNFLRRLRREKSKPFNKLQLPHITRYVKLGWTLEILHRVLLKARKSNDLKSHLLKAVIPYAVYILFPRRTRRVRRTIETYLEKVSNLF